MTFSASDAAFEGFRVVRRKPIVILWWSLAYLALFLVLIAAIGGPLLALMPQLEGLSGDGEPTAAELAGIFRLYGMVLAVALPISIVAGAVLNAAVARSVLEPGASRYGYIRFGMDEVRVGVVTVVLALMLFAAYLVGGVLIAVIAGIGSMASTAVAILLGVVVGLALIAGLIWIAVRLCLAVPITMAEKRIAIFDSFGLTKGWFWPLLGMALITIVMTILVALLGMIIGLPFQFMGGSAFERAVETGDMQTVMGALGPMVVLGLILNLIVTSLQLAVLYAPFSAAYLGIKGQAPATIVAG
jgi:hypothetical protein